MGKRQLPPEDPAEIHDVPLRDALEERYLAYALSTIMHRALPDARDGLKPVHRRILYGMDSFNLNPGVTPKKSAKIVGEVMGSYHPHGDQAIYDAMVRLAQDFSSRYPLVDGQGNFGNIDGDNPAAMRYTEARLTAVARLLLDGIDEDAVELKPTYDNSGKEPVVLPGGFPNLLANGAQGIAVGMATSIPPHNAAELCDAALHLIEKPDAKSKALLRWVKGPDFPTGGIVIDSKEAIVEAYTTGRGSFRTRARWSVEEGARGSWVVVVTEIPWLVQKSRLVEKIAELLDQKKLPLVGDVRDESAEDVRLIIEPKSRTVDPALMMESLFRLSELESKISLNLNVLVKGRIPKVIGLAECLREWLDHLRDVLIRRSEHRKGKIEHRLEVLGGLLIAYLNIDKVIKIIRTEDEPKPVLIQTFKLTDLQADSILNMRLRNLRKLEEMEIRTEDKDLRKELKGLEGLLASDKQQWDKVAEQVTKVREMFGPKTPLGKRRTTFADAPEHDLAAMEEALVEREPVTVVISEKGWVRTLKGHVEDLSGLAFKTDDKLDHAFFAETTSKLLLFATNGKFYSLDVAKLPGGRGHGEAIRMFIDLEPDAAIVALFVNKGERKFLIASSEGQGFVVKEEDCVGTTRKGRQVLNVEMPNEACAITTVLGDTVAVIGSNHKMVLFGLDQVPEMARGRGVRLQKYSGGRLSDVAVFDAKAGLTWKDSAGREHSMTMKELADWRGNRADAGRLAHGLPKSNKFNRGVE
ncbi:DNA topoisomerase IV subunit A [Bradyrhizobium jicamae]|uniref:DNA topoisomerase IV subunit A n=1 Tax=Bradyrhizobium jicamae TaxID=280332 RepID=UPI001BA5C846|nr:DNA topoisomerase IV subunit A [Bradyrhizobium jicamae]MBR0752641.1 DNA topoisomerase IV subunit A [Bradyrhizobium jicamae]